MKKVLPSIALTFAICLLAADGAFAKTGTLVVDKDGAQCPNAGYQSINAAVQAAQPGETILVCPDLYNEDVNVNKTVTLKARGAGNGDLNRGCADPARSTPDPAKDAIVSPGLIAFNLAADDIVLDGFVVQDAFFFGISSRAAFSGYRIENNLVQHNFFGVRFRSNGAKPSVLEHNCTRNNDAEGVVVTSGSQLEVSDNDSFRDPIFAEVFPPTHDIDISGNTVRESQDPDVAAIAMGANTNGSVSHNHITHGLGNGIGFAGPDQGVAPSSNIDVAHNEIRDMGGSGIRVTPGSLFGSVIQHNHSESNGRDGIRFEAGQSSGNRVEHNELRGNAEHDCHDDTVGGGTAGTANLWLLNVAATENRPGLCRRGR